MSRLRDVQPSTGCTEPSAVALAAALAARAAGGSPWWIAVACDAGTYQNGKLAGIPGCGGRAGLDLAAALGVVAGDPDQALDVLAPTRPEAIEMASNLVAGGAVSVVRRAAGPAGLSIHVRVESDRSTGEAKLDGDHLNVISLTRDGEPLPLPTWAVERPAGQARPTTIAGAFALADELDAEDEALLLEGLARNVIAAGGCDVAGLDAADAATALAEAASRARMSGQRVTVTTSGWSGNQGLVASLPLHVLGGGASRAELARALATSHLVGDLLRDGVPSPLCHATIAASAGAAAACVRLLGGDLAAAERACHLVIASAGTPSCDGAKPACGLRVGLGAGQAIRAARRALRGPVATVGGLVGSTLQETARNIAAAAAHLAAASRLVDEPA